jgi:hypothetical protein
VLSASSFPLNPKNFAKQWANLQEPPDSGQCARASKQRYQKQIKDKQYNFCLRNVAFIKDGKIIENSSASLHSADCILIMFEWQKNYWKASTVTQWWTSDNLLCPLNNLGIDKDKNSLVQWREQEFASFPGKIQKQYHQRDCRDNRRCVP